MPRRTRLIQSMFHRRLALLGAMTLAACCALGAQLARLTLVRGEALRSEAEDRLVRHRWVPTVRGRILDRHGRVLAYDRAGYDVELSYDTLSGDWARIEGRRLAYRAHRQAWRDLSAEERDAAAEPFVRACRDRLDDSWDRLAEVLGIERAELERRAGEVVARVTKVKEDVSRRAFERLESEHLARGMALDQAARARIASIAARPIAEEERAHAIATGVDDSVGFELIRLSQTRTPIVAGDGSGEATDTDLIPGLSVANAADRVYPLDELSVDVDRSTLPRPLATEEMQRVVVPSVASQILGRMREGVFETDVAARHEALDRDPALARRARAGDGSDRGEHLLGESVGHTGVERAYEHRLRGLRGLRTEHLQTGEVSTERPEPGEDVTLTIDAALQARVAAAMDPAVGLAVVHEWQKNESLEAGTRLYGSAVVLDVETGEILAMVSTPTPPRDGDWTRLGLGTPEQVELFGALFSPEIHRAFAKPYPPGSIAKAIVLCGAVERGAYTPGERIPTRGYLLEDNPEVFREWIYKTHGISHRDQLGRDPDGVDALMVSANVFFYTLGRRLGPTGMADLYRDYGVGEAFDLGLGVEWPGRVGALEGPGDGSDLSTSDAILLGIGQGPVTWTPLHAANAYATIARGGVLLEPRLIRDGGAPRVLRDLRIDPATLEAVLAGLDLGVNDEQYGTGCSIGYEDGLERERIFRVPGIRVRGKTGTATAPPVTIDPDGDGPGEPMVGLSGDHSWFVVLVGQEGGPPRYSIAVVMDYAGSGGRVSGPICDQIVRALVAEGYLRADDGLPVGSAGVGEGS